jgi:tetratricopeptide (TPR) repeat protein
LEDYPAEILTWQLVAEFVSILDYIASRQLLLRDYPAAQASYEKAIDLLSQQTAMDTEFSGKLKASMLHQLGMVAQKQRQWEQAEAHYQKALEIKTEFDDRHSQASTYHQLGRMAAEQRQWEQARDRFFQALEIYAAYQDSYYLSIVLSSLARLWRSSGDAELPAAAAEVMGITQKKATKLLQAVLNH